MYVECSEDAERPRRRYRTRLCVRGLGETCYSVRNVVPSGSPGLRGLRLSSALRAGGAIGLVSACRRFAAALWVGEELLYLSDVCASRRHLSAWAASASKFAQGASTLTRPA